MVSRKNILMVDLPVPEIDVIPHPNNERLSPAEMEKMVQILKDTCAAQKDDAAREI